MIMKRTAIKESITQKVSQNVDPRTEKMLALAIKHDNTFPIKAKAMLGPKATDHDLVVAWATLIDKALSESGMGDLSADGKFDQWLIRLYMNHINDYEDIVGEGVNALGKLRALSVRNLLPPEHQDVNRFRSLKQLYDVVNKSEYREVFRRIADSERIANMKRNKKEVVLIHDERFFVMVPLNYGACYVFNNEEGIQASFCTGSSSGETWFARYSGDGPIISIIDKSNINEEKGKWQIHSATNQFVDAHQNSRHYPQANAEEFGRLFPGLMINIVAQLEAQADELKTASKEASITGYAGHGWNIPEEVTRLRNKFTGAFTVAATDDQNQLPGLAT